MHNFVKEHFTFLVTDTVDGPDTSSKCIRVWFNAGGNNGKGQNSRKRKDRADKPYDNRGSDNWPDHLDKFLRYYFHCARLLLISLCIFAPYVWVSIHLLDGCI